MGVIDHKGALEFYQCDVDIVGTDNILAEVECITIVHHAPEALVYDFTIRLNDRECFVLWWKVSKVKSGK